MAARPSAPLVRLERRGPTAILWLDNPPVNVLTGELLNQLIEGLATLPDDLSIRAVILAGAAEKAFAAGASIREMAPLDPAGARVHGARGQAATRAIERCPLPVIAAVHGACLGGGSEIVAACDFVVASEDAVFGQPEINLGVMPGWGGTRRLPRRIGLARSRAWILTGRSVQANEALQAGLVWKVVPREELLATALGLAEELATKAPVALAAAKFAVNRAIDPGVDDGLAYELDLWAQLFGTNDQKAGMAAFLEKRAFGVVGRESWTRESQGFPWAVPRRSPQKKAEERERSKGKRRER